MDGFDWNAIWYGVPYMLQGALVTLEISACAMVLASVTGLIMGLVSASTMRIPKAIIRALVTTIHTHWDAVCDEAELGAGERDILWNGAFLKRYALEGLAEEFAAELDA